MQNSNLLSRGMQASNSHSYQASQLADMIRKLKYTKNTYRWLDSLRIIFNPPKSDSNRPQTTTNQRTTTLDHERAATELARLGERLANIATDMKAKPIQMFLLFIIRY